jgi:hypothetical protein
MRHMMLTSLVASALAVLSAVPAQAQTIDERTYFTFSAPVEVPGKTLPAGKYLFRLADPDTGRRVVQVLSADGKQVYGMFFSVSADRPVAAPAPEVRFMETPADQPVAIRTWWSPGNRIGREFIYPKDQARRLAGGAAEPVLTTQAATTAADQTDTTELARISATGSETPFAPADASTGSGPSGASQRGEIAPASIAIREVQAPAEAHASAGDPESDRD